MIDKSFRDFFHQLLHIITTKEAISLTRFANLQLSEFS